MQTQNPEDQRKTLLALTKEAAKDSSNAIQMNRDSFEMFGERRVRLLGLELFGVL